MSDFEDSDESIFSDASSSYYDDIFSDEPPSLDSMDDSICDVEESFMETSSNEKDDFKHHKQEFMIPIDDKVGVEESIKAGRRTIQLETKPEILDLSLPQLEISDDIEQRSETEEDVDEDIDLPTNDLDLSPPLVNEDDISNCHISPSIEKDLEPINSKIKITVGPPELPLKSILRNQTDPDKVKDQIEHLQNRLKFLRECRRERQNDEKDEKRNQNAEKPEETEYLSPRGSDKESVRAHQTANPRLTGGIYENLSESTRARLEKLKQDRKNKNAAILAQPMPKFNYDKLEGIKNRFEGRQAKQNSGSFEMTLMQEERDEQKRRHRENLKKFERISN